MTSHLINLIPNTLVDDFFFWGFLGGIVSYAWYLVTNKNHKTHVSIWAALYGTFLSGALGGLLAVVFDRSIELAILVGLLNQIIFIAFVKANQKGKFLEVLKEILIRYLTAGKMQ